MKNTIAKISSLGFFSLILIAGALGQNDELKGSAVFGALRARSIGPAAMSGRIADIDVVNNDPNIIFVGAAGGGVWKSTNGGLGFSPVFDKQVQSIGRVVIDQKSPDTVWVGTGEPWTRNSVSIGNGIYVSTDGGKEWTHKGLAETERIADIVIHPKKNKILFVAALGSLWNANPDRGIYKTEDFGATWTKIFYIDENTGCSDLIIDPQEPDIMYAAMWEFRREPYFFQSGGKGSGIYKTTDGGKTWKPIRNGLPKGNLGRIALGMSDSRAGLLYATVEADTNALYKSIDMGENWVRMNEGFNIGARPFYFSRLIIDPKDHNKIYKPGLFLSFSKDGGKTFSNLGGSVHSDHHALWINPNNTKQLLLGTDGGVYQSFDGGNSWRIMRNLPVSQFYKISIDDAIPYNVYGGLQDNGSWMAPNQSPNGIANSDWKNVGSGDGFYVLRHPLKKDIVFSEYQGGHVMRYELSRNTSKDIRPYEVNKEADFRFNWNTPIALSPNNPNKMYLGGQYLFVTYDMGESWAKISPDLTTNDKNKQNQKNSGGLTKDNTTAENHCTIYAIAESPLDSNIIWAGTDDGNLQVTADGGKTWSNVVKNIAGLPANTWCSYVEPSNFDKNTVYASFDGHAKGDMKPYIFKSTDLGKTWKKLSNEPMNSYVHVIKEDLKSKSVLYAGTEWGLFISIDGGEKWLAFENGVPKVAVRDIALHKTEDDIILATHGRGVLIIDDISPIRQITPEVIGAEFTFLKTKPVELKSASGFQNFPGDDEFVGQNPNESAQILYFMNKRHMVGDMTIEIYDAAGKLIKNLPAGKQRGINKVEWITRMKAPKLPPGATVAGGAFFGPTLLEGIYTIKIKKNDKTYTGSIELTADSNSPHSKEDRLLKQKTALKAYEMIERLGYVASHLQNWAKTARDYTQNEDKIKASAKQVLELVKKLEDFNKTLVSTDKGGVFAGEELLREKITDVYGNINGYEGRPSQSQILAVESLDKELIEAEKKFEGICNNEFKQLNALITKAGLKALELKSFEKFREE